ncbi:ABC transporter ATP-binding protein [Tissierella praeacuta]|uniref:ABC transporter ATP-binding protein n=1 Tax=Tissierella praeacuta TaxID=43131 RepID=UPI00333F646B
MEEAVCLKNITKSFNGQVILDNINLSIKKGSIVGLLGKNGAGKTTLMKCITGLIKPDTGDILFRDQNFKDKRVNLKTKSIGYIIEYPGFYPDLSAKENLKIFSLLYGIEDNKRIGYVLKKVGLSNTQNKPFKNFSLGMKQRLGLANALLSEPEILILDEPINGLDPIGISQMRDLLKQLCKVEGKTILISSHILSEIELIADEICLLNDKRIIEQVKVKELEKNKDSYIVIDTDNCKRAIEVIQDRLGIKLIYRQVERELRIFNNGIETYRLNDILVNNGIKINEIYREKSGLEEHFKMMLGERND